MSRVSRRRGVECARSTSANSLSDRHFGMTPPVVADDRTWRSGWWWSSDHDQVLRRRGRSMRTGRAPGGSLDRGTHRTGVGEKLVRITSERVDQISRDTAGSEATSPKPRGSLYRAAISARRPSSIATISAWYWPSWVMWLVPRPNTAQHWRSARGYWRGAPGHTHQPAQPGRDAHAHRSCRPPSRTEGPLWRPLLR